MEPYRSMALNNAWANRVLYGALAGLPPGAFTAPRPGFFPSLCATLNHVHDVDLYYLDALEEGGLGRHVYDRAPVEDATELGRLQAGADLRLARFCDALTPDRLDRAVRTERAEAPQVTERTGAVILHLVQHQIHHRGQAHVQLQDAGLAPPQLDEFFLDHDRAESAKAYFA